MTNVIVDSTNKSESDWQRLSPFSIVFFIFNFTIRFIKDGIINLAPALAIFITQVEDKLFWLGIAGIIFVIGLIIYSILYYQNFRYRVTEGQVILRRGILNKERTTLAFEKVQNVNLATPFYFEPLKLVNCIFDSAGSAQKEISLPGISIDYAETVRADIFSYKQKLSTVESNDDINEANEQSDAFTSSDPLIKLSLGEIARFGLSSNMTFILLAVLAPFMDSIVDFAKASIVPNIVSLLDVLFPQSPLLNVFATLFFVTVVILFAVLLSVLSSIVQFYNFELFDEGKQLKRTAGLFEKHQISIAKHRVQAISIKQNWVFKLLRRVTMQFHQLAIAHGQNAKNKNNLSIPTLSPDAWHSVVHTTYENLDAEQISFIGISTRYLSHCIAVFWLAPLTVAALLLMHLDTSWIWLIACTPVGGLLVYLRWRRFGLWFNDDYVAIRSGFIGQKISIIPLYKIQNIGQVQTPMLRRNNLASVVLQLPYGKETIPFLPKRKARAFLNLCAYKMESSTKHWL
ncbi:PH domain-containing protein [Psychrosphaera aestuarii]|uniref:PH domain-containing protein n=1 Tax=Psychrosphaera aestuarii TaxID=1266052 RepID=UPI001B337207|nr:PH domain-containing protein [Psychrosphaera aestuarii]